MAEKPKPLTAGLLRRMRTFKDSEPDLAVNLRAFGLRADGDAAVLMNLEDILSPNFDPQDVVEVLANRLLATSASDTSADSKVTEIGDGYSNCERPVDARQNQIEEMRFGVETGSLGWYVIFADRPPQRISQPRDFVFIADRPDEAARPRWMQKSGMTEIAADGKALYKIQAGRRTLLLRGDYEIILVTVDGRWAFAFNKTADWELVKIDLIARRTTRLVELERTGYYPAFSVPGTNLVALEIPRDAPDDSSFESRWWESVGSGKG